MKDKNQEIEKITYIQIHEASKQGNRLNEVSEASGSFSNEDEANSRSHSSSSKRDQIKFSFHDEQTTHECPGASFHQFSFSDPSGTPPNQSDQQHIDYQNFAAQLQINQMILNGQSNQMLFSKQMEKLSKLNQSLKHHRSKGKKKSRHD